MTPALGETLDEARDALRERQGGGARYDAPEAPDRELAWARTGTAYFARSLMNLDNAGLREPSSLPGWSNAALVAHVGYNARALARLVQWARTGVETPMYASMAQRAAEIELGATLPPRALRHLFDHSEVHLNVEWRDLPGPAWDHLVTTAQGRTVPARDTPWLRAREVWIHAVDLDPTASFLDFPAELVDRLIDDVGAVWSQRDQLPDLTLVATDRTTPRVLGAGSVTVAGRSADLARWLTGRGARRLTSSTTDLPPIPRWL